MTKATNTAKKLLAKKAMRRTRGGAALLLPRLVSGVGTAVDLGLVQITRQDAQNTSDAAASAAVPSRRER